jgi:hypothetical protein
VQQAATAITAPRASLRRAGARLAGRRGQTRWTTFATVVALAASFACAFVSAASAFRPPRRSQSSLHRALSKREQGIFERCSLATAEPNCVQRLALMHAGGLNVVVFPVAGASLYALGRYAAAARRLGMSVMWELGDPVWWQQSASGTRGASDFPQFAAACGCSASGDLLAYIVRWMGSLPATFGYYAIDDTMLEPGDREAVAAYLATIKRIDPVHVTMIGAFSDAQRREYEGLADLVGQEVYPITTSPILPQGDNWATWSELSREARDTQRQADRAGKQSAFILQAFSWGDNVADGSAIGICPQTDTTIACAERLRYPRPQEQLVLRNTIQRVARPRLVLWYSFPGTYGQATNPDPFYAPISYTEAAQRWIGLSAAIKAPLPVALSKRGDCQNRARPRQTRCKARRRVSPRKST